MPNRPALDSPGGGDMPAEVTASVSIPPIWGPAAKASQVLVGCTGTCKRPQLPWPSKLPQAAQAWAAEVAGPRCTSSGLGGPLSPPSLPPPPSGRGAAACGGGAVLLAGPPTPGTAPP